MEVDRTHTQETSRNQHNAITWNPPREEVGHETPGKEKETKEMDFTRRDVQRMATDKISGVPWSMAYAPSDQTGIS